MNDVRNAVAAVRRAETLDRKSMRATFERRFTAERMAKDYLAIYRGLPVRTEAARVEERPDNWARMTQVGSVDR